MRIIGLYGHSNCGKSETVNELKEFADSEGVKVEWIAKSYEYNLSRETQKMCNQEMAEVVMKKLK